ncbi:MAG: bifunctional [glutamate--ammonia ligase]-adenylyl-L-tyrosine phosphorylase/[glutamate--ammonia-ligase] adenylyltransferase [Myxococcota bacterium]
MLELAHAIDPQRARDLQAELGDSASRAPLILLAAAFPPFTPGTAQLPMLERVIREGLQAPRRRLELLADAQTATERVPRGDAFARELRRFVWVERARIALRELLPPELGGAPIAVTAYELSLLAEVALELALTEAVRQTSAQYGTPLKSDGNLAAITAFGMGKLGGQELNAGSDVDLVFVYDTDDGSAGDLSLHEYWSRVVRRAVALLDTPSEDGLIWRVDLRLRPEGSGGPVANSVAATERYYETWGRQWERAALLRSRAVAGSFELGAVISREIFAPFVYRREVDPSIAATLLDMVERARIELSKSPERDLKLCRGGIREAEFFVQALQLVWGGRETSLQVPGTLRALSRLEGRGLVTAREARKLAEGYAFLRRLEHRVQWSTGVQTHLLPADTSELMKLGRSLGHADERALLAELAVIRERIQELFDSVVPGRAHHAAPSPFRALLAQLGDRERTRAEAERLFGHAEFGDHLLALARRPDDILGELTRERYPKLGDQLLHALSASSDPEQALRYLRAFFGRFLTPSAYVQALAEDDRALFRVVSVLGASRMVGDTLVARPELADAVVFGDAQVSDPIAAIEVELLAEERARNASARAEEREENFVAALRIAKRRVMLEVAVADLAGALNTREATGLLAELADEIVRRTAAFILGDQARGLCLIALGKFGGCELGYGSDLDVIFVFDPLYAPSRDEALSYYAARAQRILRLLTEPNAAGPGYALDTRLRPSGAQGLLVTSIGAFARYHGVDAPEARANGSQASMQATSSGAAWERQALLRARACAGDRRLGDRVIELARIAAYERGAPPVDELMRLRQRMEVELARERQGRFDLKTGRGGLLDVEFCVQYLQMRHGTDPRVRTTDTAAALSALHEHGYLERSLFLTLREGYRFLRRLEQRLHVITGASASLIDANSPTLNELGRSMGFSDEPGRNAGAQLTSRYEAVTNSIREAYLAALGRVEASPESRRQ